MRRWLMAVTAVLLLASTGVFGQAPAARRTSADDEADKLPVRRVVLYKTGVGYFEHLGRVRGAQAVVITFTSAQLNDVLKSLTTLDLGGGRITSVSYNSAPARACVPEPRTQDRHCRRTIEQEADLLL